MVTYLYCVLAPPKTEAVPAGRIGIGDAPVRALVVPARESLEAWVASVDETLLRATESALARLALLHNEVVEAALATGRTPLPARFGSRFADDDALRTDLGARHATLIDRLHRVAGAIEMSVLVVARSRAGKRIGPRPRHDELGAGRRYLEAVRDRTRSEEHQYEEATRVADRVNEAVSSLTRGDVLSTSSNGLSIAHLVLRADVERYRHALSKLDVGGEFRIIVGAPRAPYSFAAE